MAKSDVEKGLNLFEKRIKRLENAVFRKKIEAVTEKNFKGLVGGINFLIGSGFFKKLRLKKEVHEELRK